jgi:hypothetical protein
MKCSLSDIESLSAEIENLGTVGPEQLDQAWRDLFESDRPRRVCGDLLIKSLGYRLQEKAIGGLKPSTRRLLQRWGRNGWERGPLAEPARTRLKASVARCPASSASSVSPRGVSRFLAQHLLD